jgi:hypothetical protein
MDAVLPKIEHAALERLKQRQTRRKKDTAVPTYANTFPPFCIAPGDQAQVWTSADGNLISGTKTQRIAITAGGPITRGRLSLRVSFSGAPGVISLQLQTSDTDVDTDYNNEGASIAAVNANNVARAEYANVSAKFARLLATTVTNVVTATVELAA